MSTLGLNEVKDGTNFDILEIKLNQCDLEKLQNNEAVAIIADSFLIKIIKGV